MFCTSRVACPAVTGYWCATPAVVAATKASGEKFSSPLLAAFQPRSEEHTSELQSLMRTSYAGFCLKKKKNIKKTAEPRHKEVRPRKPPGDDAKSHEHETIQPNITTNGLQSTKSHIKTVYYTIRHKNVSHIIFMRNHQ